MSDTSLIFNLLAIDRASEKILGVKSAFGLLAVGAAASVAAIAVKTVDMAGDFQAAMTRVETGAGELHANMKMVGDGVLEMAGKVGQGTHELTAGLYMVNSAGYHGADGLHVLEIAAKGAKVGAAELGTVADAVTTALNAYHMGAGGAAEAMNALIGAEKAGKTNMEALASSLATVAPAAAVAGVKLNEVLAAMATMTAQGTSAANAATYLRQTILQLSNPTGKAAQEMKSLGLDATQVSLNLGKNGLAATLTMLTDAIATKMGPAGTVLIEHLKKAAHNATDFQKVLAQLPPSQQTYIGALATMVGGTKSMQAALELTGDNMQTFKNNIVAISENVKAGGNDVEGWAAVQENFNQKMAEAKATIEALGIKIGTVLLPYAQKMLEATMQAVEWGTKHKEVVKDAAIGVGVLAAGFLAYKTYLLAAFVATKTWVAIQWVATAAQWALNVAMEANPIGLVVIAVVALVAGIYLLWTHSAGFRNFFIGMWQHIWSFLKTVGSWFKDVLWGQYLKPAIDAIAGAAVWLWNTVLKPVFGFIGDQLAFVGNIVKSLGNLWLYVWKQVIGVAIATTKVDLQILGAVFGWLYDNVIKPVVDGIAASWNWLWGAIVGPTINTVKLDLALLGDAFMWLWHNAIEPAWQGISNAIDFAWNGIIKPAWNQLVQGVQWVGGVFHDVFTAVGSWIADAFHTAVSTVKGAINSLIDLLNKAVGFINSNVIDTLNKVPGVSFLHIMTMPHLATGGQLTGGGLVEVGEKGAEVVSLPAGAAVYPHGSSPRGGPTTVVLNFQPSGDPLMDAIVKALRKHIRIEGGDVQLVLGQG